MRNTAESITKVMGHNWAANHCWMSRSNRIQISASTSAHGNHILAAVTITRLLAFFADPSDGNFAALTSLTPTASPFSHACRRGHLRSDGGVGCINGVYHGRFATRYENESHKLCTNGALALCPGHGNPPVKCIFTHPDGTLQPCRMKEDSVPKCSCLRPCF